MQILNLSKEDGEAIIRLDATELTTLCNSLYYCRKEMLKMIRTLEVSLI